MANPSQSYGTLLGTEIFQSFIGGIISFRALSRPQFSVLQQHIFPVYFGMQATLPIFLALTYPSSASVSGGYAGVLHDDNRFSVLLPLVIMAICGLTNWIFLGPTTTKTMRKRKHQETKDGKKYYDAGPHSEEMKKLNTQFSMLHGFSSLVNLVQIICTIWYGVNLSTRL
jgi:hypothetical protein